MSVGRDTIGGMFRLYKCEHELVVCPRHEGGFDCTPFCNLCEGNQEYCPNGCEPIACNSCCVYEWHDTKLTEMADDFYLCDECKEENVGGGE